MPENRRITVEVTKEDIAKGTPGDACLCPIALAIGRVLPNLLLVEVEGSYIQIEVPGQFYECHMPESASDFVIAFDLLKPVEPFTFEIDLDEVWLSDD